MDVTCEGDKSRNDRSASRDRQEVGCSDPENRTRLAVQLGAKAHSMPAPASQPLLLLLFETLIEPPVVTLVRVGLLTPTQPPPPLA